MADWKAQISYNYNPSYHAYAYSLMYQPGSEPGHSNSSSWAETGVTDLSNYTQAYYPPAAQMSPDQSPPESPEPQAYSGHSHCQGPGLVHLGDTEASRLLLVDQRDTESRRVGSDSSDSEPHKSPDSCSSGSSGGDNLPSRADPATWAHKDPDDETICRSPDPTDNLCVKEKPQTFLILGSESTNNTSTSVKAPAPKSTKAKVRAAFSESQMNALIQRFNVQRYLTPAEMKNLAELTGLTYKQVKTWFQNRRMKLRRHQKDNSWASERYTGIKNARRGAVLNLSTHIQPYQGEARPTLKEHFNPHVTDAAFKKTTPPNLAFYLATAGGAAGSAGYPWSSSAAQTGVHSRPQVPSWPLLSDGSHFGFSAFNPLSVSTAADTGFKEGEQINSRANAAIVQSASQ